MSGDGLLAVTRQALVDAVSTRGRRLLGVAVGVAYLLVYLWAIQHLVVTRTDFGRFVDIPSVQLASDWTSKLLQQRASFSYEPIIAIYPNNHVLLLIAPLNVAMGALLAALVAANFVLAVHLFRVARTCRRRAFGGVLGAIPALFTGFACCVPTFALALGAQFAVLLIAVRTWFFPAALVALIVALLWNGRRAAVLQRETLMPVLDRPVGRGVEALVTDRNG